MQSHLMNIALNLEMAIANRREKKYRTERSRNKDIIADYKEIIRHEQDMVETNEDACFIHMVGGLLSNTMLDTLTDEEIAAVYTLVIHFLKQDFQDVEKMDFVAAPQRVTKTKPKELYTPQDFFGGN